MSVYRFSQYRWPWRLQQLWLSYLIPKALQNTWERADFTGQGEHCNSAKDFDTLLSWDWYFLMTVTVTDHAHISRLGLWMMWPSLCQIPPPIFFHQLSLTHAHISSGPFSRWIKILPAATPNPTRHRQAVIESSLDTEHSFEQVISLTEYQKTSATVLQWTYPSLHKRVTNDE